MRRGNPLPDLPGGALLRLVPKLWPLLIVVLLGLGLLTISAYRVSSKLDDARIAQSDNTTWLIAQIEVELLKLSRAIDAARYGPVHSSGLGPVRQAFDVYFSRVSVIEGFISRPGRLNVQQTNADWQTVQAQTQILRAMVDVPDAALWVALPAMSGQLARMHRPMRDFTVSSLSLLVEGNARDREALRGMLARFATVALALIGLLLGTTWLMLRLSQQLQRRSQEAERVRSNLEKTLSASLDGVILARADGRIVTFNPAAEAIFGYSRDEMVAADFAKVLLPGHLSDPQTQKLRDFLGGGLAGEAPQGRVVLTSVRRDGTAFPIELALATDRDSDGIPVFFAFIRDISEQVRFEASLREARDAAVEAADTKARFLAVMSHEMRTPLNGVIAALDILRETTKLSAKQARFLSIAESAAQLALDQINDVLELARLNGDVLIESPSAFNLTRVIADLAEQAMPLAQKQGNRITLDLPPEAMAEVSGMRRIFLRTLLNLVGNAAKFTHDGTIAIRATLLPDVGNRLLVRVEVSDTGIGIAQDKLHRIFDAFETLDSGYDRAVEGTGLGLGIAQRAVEHMGGEIGVSSTPGVGSRFWFTAPMQRAAQDVDTDQPLPDPQADASLPRHKVLIVEDNATNRIVVREMLEHLGQQVTEAEDGARAITLARQQAFDLILMDISMPVIDGLTATQAIRASGASADARIVGLTAHGLPEELRRFEAGGLPEVLRKPLTFAALTQVLSGPLPPAAESGIDAQVVQELRDLLSPEARQQALFRFLDEGDAFQAQLTAPAVQSAQLAEAAHRLQGAAAVLGAVALTRRLVAVERAARNADATALAAHHAGFAAEWAALRSALPRCLLQ